MHVVLVHGMGRSPLSMAWLYFRLRLAGHRVSAFSYSAARQDFRSCVVHLADFLATKTAGQTYAVIGHSLGTVFLRSVLAEIQHQPTATFLLAPPTRACAMAKLFSAWPLYRLATGECGQLLADEDFMRSLPPAPANSLIFAGISGPRRHWLPNGIAPNDGVLAVAETRLSGIPHFPVRTIHTFIMNHRSVIQAICNSLSKTA
jgi:hypothetical protein